MTKILVVDDEQATSEIIKDALLTAGYLVDVGASALEAEAYLKNYPYDMAIFDWELPDASGPSIVEKLRHEGKDIPILMLTARTSIDDKQIGYDSGVDDYLIKPFVMQELLLKVKAILKRPRKLAPKVLKVRNIVLDLNTQEVFKDQDLISLLPKEFALLAFFMRNPRQVFNADALLDRVWKTEAAVGLEIVRVTLMRIRQKLESTGEEPLIITIRGFGYRLDP